MKQEELSFLCFSEAKNPYLFSDNKTSTNGSFRRLQQVLALYKVTEKNSQQVFPAPEKDRKVQCL